MSVTNGLCPAGRATLEAHEKQLDQHEAKLEQLESKLDRINWLLVATLAAVVTQFGYMLIDGR